MYPSRDSNETVRLPTPQGYETLGKVIQTTMWLDSQLRWLERGKPCKRISALRTNLTAMLDDTNFDNLVVSREDHSKILSAERLSHQNIVDALKLELNKSKEKLERVVSDLQEARDLGLEDKQASTSSSSLRQTVGLVVWTVVVMITTLVLFHHSG